jgi:2-polyprenyl-3-methyl-5-hydroxy-6-metoxy-1,4-benzoquinol methylase
MIDSGTYNNDQKLYEKLVNKVYTENPPLALSAEYSSFVKDNLLQLMIRLARYKFVARLVKPTDHILEVGCGSGLGTIFLGQHCRHISGIDVKSTEIEEAKSINRRENVDFSIGDFFQMSTEKKYDVIVALDVIEHMTLELGSKLISKMAANLSVLGMVIIGTPSIYSYPYQSELSKASHVKCYDQKELVDLLEKFYGRTLAFSMNDEIVHTGFEKLAWYYFIIGFLPGKNKI